MPLKSEVSHEAGTSFNDFEKGNRPRTCNYATPDLCCSSIPMFSDEDIVAVRVNNVCRKGDKFVFVSAYMAAKEPAPPNLLRDLLVLTENEQTPIIVGTDANAHHTNDINPQGEDLQPYCVSADLNFRNEVINQHSELKRMKRFWTQP